MMINRRKLITGLISFVAAPAIVRASNMMPVKVINILPDIICNPIGLKIGDIVTFYNQPDKPLRYFIIKSIHRNGIDINDFTRTTSG